MSEETKEQPNNSNNSQENNQEAFAGANRAPLVGGGAEADGADESNDQAEEEKAPDVKALEPGGIMVLIVAAIFDILGLISAAMIAWFGVGVIMGRVVSVMGFAVIALLLKVRGNDTAALGAAQDKAMDLIKTFLKRNKGNVIAEAVPVVGDLWPGFTLMAYKALSGK